MRGRIAIALVSVLSVGAALAPVIPAAATGSPTSAGYIYHMSGSGTGHLMRYNILEGADEVISTADPSCADTSLNRVADLELDATHNFIYWIAETSRLVRFNLTTGVCQVILDEYNQYNSNGRYATWRGLDIDPARDVLFFVDNLGWPTGSETLNKTLHYVTLSDIPATGSVSPSVDHIVGLTKAAGEETDVSFAMDITINGDFGYIAAKNDGSINNAAMGSAIYKVRLFDATSHLPVSATESIKVYKFTELSTYDPQMINLVFHNGFVYYSSYNWRWGGITKVDLSTYTAGNPVTAYTRLVTNENTYDITLGLDFGQNDEVFFSDRPTWPGPFKLMWADGSVSAPSVDHGTSLNSETDSYEFGQINYSSALLPSTLTVSTFTRDDDTSGTVTFATPSDAAPSTSYLWTAVGSDSSTLSGTCSSSPCSLTGLTAGVTYTVQLRQSWRDGASEIVHSLQSTPVTESSGFTAAHKSFSGFVTMQSELSGGMKKWIRRWVQHHIGASTISCTGYVGNNYLGVTVTELRSLARARASAVCGFSRSVDTGIGTQSIGTVISTSRDAKIRKVLVELS